MIKGRSRRKYRDGNTGEYYQSAKKVAAAYSGDGRRVILRSLKEYGQWNGVYLMLEGEYTERRQGGW